MDDTIIRDLNVDEAELAVKFFEEHWRSNHIFKRELRLFYWLYRDAPCASIFSKGLTIKAALNNSTLAGIFGYTPFVFNDYGQRKYGSYLSAWWVAPEYLNQPLSIRLLYAIQRQMPFEVLFGGMLTEVASRMFSGMRWRMISNLSRLILPISVSQMTALAAQYPAAEAEIELRLRNWHMPVIPIQPQIDVIELHNLEDLRAMDWDKRYWRRFAPEVMSVAREVDHLIWRFQQIPVFQYHTLLAQYQSEIDGLLVYRIEQIHNHSEKIIRLVDLIAEPSAVPALISAMLKQVQAENPILIDYFYSTPVYEAALKKCCFIGGHREDSSYWYPYLFQPLDFSKTSVDGTWWTRDGSFRNRADTDFFVTKGDYEFDRPN